MDRRDMESRYGVYAAIDRVRQLLCQDDCIADAEEWSKEI